MKYMLLIVHHSEVELTIGDSKNRSWCHWVRNKLASHSDIHHQWGWHKFFKLVLKKKKKWYSSSQNLWTGVYNLRLIFHWLYSLIEDRKNSDGLYNSCQTRVYNVYICLQLISSEFCFWKVVHRVNLNVRKKKKKKNSNSKISKMLVP